MIEISHQLFSFLCVEFLYQGKFSDNFRYLQKPLRKSHQSFDKHCTVNIFKHIYCTEGYTVQYSNMYCVHCTKNTIRHVLTIFYFLFSNMYGVHPRLTLLDKNGDAAGILFLNSAAQVQQSINQTISQSFNQSISQSVNQSIN